MWVIPEQLNAIVRNNLETANRFAAVTLVSVEKLAEVQMKAAKEALTDAATRTRTLSGVKDVREFIQTSPADAQAGLEKATAMAREFYAVAAKAQSDLGKLFDEQFVAINKQAVGAIDTASKSAPAGSDYAFTAMKSAIAMASSAYDNATRAARQVAESTQANIAQATQATGRRNAA